MADRQAAVTADGLLAAAATGDAGAGGVTVEQVTERRDGDVLEARSTSQTIRTVDDLLRRIGADLTAYEVAASEATAWEGLTADRATGKPVVTTLHRVWVRLKPRPGPGVREAVEAMIEAAAARVRAAPLKARQRRPQPGSWCVLVIADTHFGKYAWSATDGQDYDLSIASRLVSAASSELLAVAREARPERLTVAFLGDLFHYDTPGGTTTKGTPLERDGRLQKMFASGCDCLLGIVDAAATVSTAVDTLIVNGNHDEVLTWSFHRLLTERFRGHPVVTVEQGYTPRKYLAHGDTLLGFAHGHKAKRKLPQLMALEAAVEWARRPHREYHTGHLHHQAAEWSRPIETLDGVLVRVAPAVCPPDGYHATEGYVGSRQAMELFVYANGGMTSMHVAGV